MKIVSFIFCVILLASCNVSKTPTKQLENETALKIEINKVLDKWHKDAANTNFDAYFSAMTTDAVFIGTDASEHWTLEAFKTYAKPHFDKGKAWHFKPLQRHIFMSEIRNIVWFDELLDTQMKLCRGSGVLKREGNKWKIVHYVLSLTVPNEKIRQIVGLKKKNDSIFEVSLKKNP